jgi:hypothetical protein
MAITPDNEGESGGEQGRQNDAPDDEMDIEPLIFKTKAVVKAVVKEVTTPADPDFDEGNVFIFHNSLMPAPDDITRNWTLINGVALLKVKKAINWCNHENTIQDLLRLLRYNNASFEDMADALKKTLNIPFAVLVTLSGCEADTRLGLMAKAVAVILKKQSPTILPMVPTGSKWAVVRCSSLAEKEVLLATKVVWLTESKVFAVFRKIRFQPFLTKYIQALGVKSSKSWDAALAALNKEGVVVTPHEPLEFRHDYTERFVWKVVHKDPRWIFPTDIELSPYETVIIKWAPICQFCSGEDHHYKMCGFPTIVGATPPVKKPDTRQTQQRRTMNRQRADGPPIASGSGSGNVFGDYGEMQGQRGMQE